MAALKKRVASLELELAVAKARAASPVESGEFKAADAILPLGHISNESFEGQLLAYHEITKIAGEVDRRIRQGSDKGASFIVEESFDPEWLSAYNAVLAQVDVLLKEFRGRTPGPAGSLSPQSAAAAFGRKLVLGDETTVTAAKGHANTFSLPLLSVETMPVPVARQALSPAVEALVAELTRRLNGYATLRSISLAPPFSSTSRLVERLNALAELRERMADMPSEKKALKAFDDAIAALWKYVSAPAEKDARVSRLSMLRRAEAIKTQLDHGAQILYVKVIASGGLSRVRQTRWRFSKEAISHSGGAVVAFHVLDATGATKLSGTVYSFSGYRDGVARTEPVPLNNFESR